MNRIRIFIVLFLALGLGGTFALATYRYIQNRPVEKVSLPTTPVVVAGADLALGAELRRKTCAPSPGRRMRFRPVRSTIRRSSSGAA